MILKFKLQYHFLGMILVLISLSCLAWIGCEDQLDQLPPTPDADSDSDSDSDSDTDADADDDDDNDNDNDNDNDDNDNDDNDNDDNDNDDNDNDDNDITCEDKDSDWWCGEFDCNDEDPTVNNGAVEIPDNEVDDDCDGVTDEIVVDPEEIKSFLWVANSGESTLSKVHTIDEIEVARYKTCPHPVCDPSRTSVNLHGDMVVTNRHPEGDISSVVKFAADLDDCIDRNDNDKIDTSTGPTDVLPWGEDECMLWHIELEKGDAARATAWDGTEDKDTGLGGKVLIGTCMVEGDGFVNTNKVYALNGDTGEIDKIVEIKGFNTQCLYGGAIDPNGAFWLMDGFGWPNAVVKVDVTTGTSEKVLDATNWDSKEFHCGYGITADSDGRVWSAGKHHTWDAVVNEYTCVQRYDPVAGTSQIAEIEGASWLRGVAVGIGKSEGFAWSVGSNGKLFKINAETMTLDGTYTVVDGLDDSDEKDDTVGVAIDHEGFVWTVCRNGTAYKFDPDTEQFTEVKIGEDPYTYSDMTGVQLRNVIITK